MEMLTFFPFSGPDTFPSLYLACCIFLLYHLGGQTVLASPNGHFQSNPMSKDSKSDETSESSLPGVLHFSEAYFITE